MIVDCSLADAGPTYTPAGLSSTGDRSDPSPAGMGRTRTSPSSRRKPSLHASALAPVPTDVLSVVKPKQRWVPLENVNLLRSEPVRPAAQTPVKGLVPGRIAAF